MGLTRGCGGEGARITSRMYCGGWLYPEAVSAGFAGDAGFAVGEADCAKARTPKKQIAKAAAAQRKGFRILIVFSPRLDELQSLTFATHEDSEEQPGREN